VNITLTGAAGKLGAPTCRALAEAGHQVRAIDQRMRRDLPVPVEVVNLLDREACYRILDGADAVVHLANHPHDSGPDRQRILRDNVAMNTHVFQAALEVGVQSIVFASSIQALGFGRKDGDDYRSTLAYLPLDGDLPAQPTNVYGVSKQLSEEMLRYYAREQGMNCTALRFPFLSQGAARSGRNRAEHSPQHVPTDHINEAWSYLSFADASALIVAILAAPLTGFRIYSPASRSNRLAQPVAPLIQTYFEGIPLKKPLEEIDSFFDLSRITEETGWEPVDE
jgi:nucleoside-diphosphate-sugar epimerase